MQQNNNLISSTINNEKEMNKKELINDSNKYVDKVNQQVQLDSISQKKTPKHINKYEQIQDFPYTIQKQDYIYIYDDQENNNKLNNKQGQLIPFLQNLEKLQINYYSNLKIMYDKKQFRIQLENNIQKLEQNQYIEIFNSLVEYQQQDMDFIFKIFSNNFYEYLQSFKQINTTYLSQNLLKSIHYEKLAITEYYFSITDDQQLQYLEDMKQFYFFKLCDLNKELFSQNVHVYLRDQKLKAVKNQKYSLIITQEHSLQKFQASNLQKNPQMYDFECGLKVLKNLLLIMQELNDNQIYLKYLKNDHFYWEEKKIDNKSYMYLKYVQYSPDNIYFSNSQDELKNKLLNLHQRQLILQFYLNSFLDFPNVFSIERQIAVINKNIEVIFNEFVNMEQFTKQNEMNLQDLDYSNFSIDKIRIYLIVQLFLSESCFHTIQQIIQEVDKILYKIQKQFNIFDIFEQIFQRKIKQQNQDFICDKNQNNDNYFLLQIKWEKYLSESCEIFQDKIQIKKELQLLEKRFCEESLLKFSNLFEKINQQNKQDSYYATNVFQQINLIDTYTQEKLEYPAHSVNCTMHFESFNLNTLKELQEDGYPCPICNTEIQLYNQKNKQKFYEENPIFSSFSYGNNKMKQKQQNFEDAIQQQTIDDVVKSLTQLQMPEQQNIKQQDEENMYPFKQMTIMEKLLKILLKINQKFKKNRYEVCEADSLFLPEIHKYDFGFTMLLSYVKQKTKNIECLANKFDSNTNKRNKIIIENKLQEYFILKKKEQNLPNKYVFELKRSNNFKKENQIEFPVRSTNCYHLQCFDLKKIYQNSKQFDQLYCPICSEKYQMHQLIYDFQQEKNLKFLKQVEKINEIEFESNIYQIDLFKDEIQIDKYIFQCNLSISNQKIIKNVDKNNIIQDKFDDDQFEDQLISNRLQQSLDQQMQEINENYQNFNLNYQTSNTILKQQKQYQEKFEGDKIYMECEFQNEQNMEKEDENDYNVIQLDNICQQQPNKDQKNSRNDNYYTQQEFKLNDSFNDYGFNFDQEQIPFYNDYTLYVDEEEKQPYCQNFNKQTFTYLQQGFVSIESQ